VGETIARNAWPARIGRDGTLHVSAADAVWAFELTQRAGEIAARLGVAAVRFAPGPVTRAAPAPEPRRAPPVPSAEEECAAAEIAAGASDENLRKALQRVISLGLSRAASGHPV
jgi:hypothetical protein